MIKREIVEAVIGKTFADKLDELVIDISPALCYSRRAMVEELNCANYIAAIRLAKVLRRLGITTPAKLFKTDPFSLARAKGIGETALFVAACILDANDYDVPQWWGWKQDNNVVKFSTFKHHAMQRASKRKQAVA